MRKMTLVATLAGGGQGEINTGEATDEINANDRRQTSFPVLTQN